MPNAEPIGKERSSTSAQNQSQNYDVEEEEDKEEEDDDDWDFQSFPASAYSTARNIAEENGQGRKTSDSENGCDNDEFIEFAASSPQEHSQEEMDSDTVSEKIGMRESRRSRNDVHVDDSSSYNQNVENVESPIEKKSDSDASSDKSEMVEFEKKLVSDDASGDGSEVGESGGSRNDEHRDEPSSRCHRKVEEAESPTEEEEKVTDLQALEHEGGSVSKEFDDDQRISEVILEASSRTSSESAGSKHAEGPGAGESC